jgi:hypothetical protein
MKRIFLAVLVFVFISLSSTFAQNFNSRTTFSAGILAGYNNGIGFQGNFSLKNLAEGFPFNIKLGIGFSYLDPGKPLEAREIFINDATNGVPEKAGRLVDFRADFLYNVSGRTYFYTGPRFTMFTANFNFVGGNEDFDVTANQWGVGVGVENYFRISPVIDLVFSLGYDYFFQSVLYGHDTSYGPDGENVNDRKDFTFEDADNAVNQPKHNLKAMVGLGYNF